MQSDCHSLSPPLSLPGHPGPPHPSLRHNTYCASSYIAIAGNTIQPRQIWEIKSTSHFACLQQHPVGTCSSRNWSRIHFKPLRSRSFVAEWHKKLFYFRSKLRKCIFLCFLHGTHRHKHRIQQLFVCSCAMRGVEGCTKITKARFQLEGEINTKFFTDLDVGSTACS